MNIAQCQLCGQQKKLLRHSHVIPKFMEKSIKDDLHRMKLKKNIEDPRPGIYIQKGFTVRDILCATCDNHILGRLEKYLSEFIDSPDYQNTIVKRSRRIIPGTLPSHRFNVDYTKFKLGILSIVWRAHLSNHYFHKEIDLGSFADILKDMILNQSAGDKNFFRISIFALTTDMEALKIVMQPFPVEVADFKYLLFLISGAMYFIETKYNPENTLFKTHLKEDGTLIIPVLNMELSKVFINAIFKREDGFELLLRI